MKSIETFTEDPTVESVSDRYNENEKDPKWMYKQMSDDRVRQYDGETNTYAGGFENDHLWASQLVKAPSFESNDKGTSFQAMGRHVFEDVEGAGQLRVGAAWDMPGIFAEAPKDMIVGVHNEQSVHVGAYGSGKHMSVNPDGSVRVRGRVDCDRISFPNGWQLKPKRYDLCFSNQHGVEFCLSERLPPRHTPWLVKPLDEQVNLVKR